VKFKKGETVIYPQHGACKVVSIRKEDPLNTGKAIEYLELKTVIGEMTLKVPTAKAMDVGVRPPVSPDELNDLVAVLSKPDPRVPGNWSRRFKNHQEKLKSGDVYQVAEVVRNLSVRNHDASLSAAERSMYDRARTNLISEIAPALKVSAEEAEVFLDQALTKGMEKAAKAAAKAAPKPAAAAPAAKAAPAAPAKKPAPPAKKAAPVVAKTPAKPATKAPAKPAPKTTTKAPVKKAVVVAKKAPATKAPAKKK
jgi:CarD family transcriptional regulator